MRHGSNEEELSFKIGTSVVKETASEKLLGLWVSNDLNWSKHIEELEDELSFRLYTLRKLEQSIPKSLLKTVADGIFNSLLRYGLGIFCPIKMKETDPTPNCINGIRVHFRNVLRLLCGSKREEHLSIRSMLDKVGWLSLNQLACEVRLTETWKALHLENYCLKDIFERIETSGINTRSSNKIRLKSAFKSRLRESSFQYPSVQLWNCAPQEVTEATTEPAAKAAIRKFVCENIPI